MTNSKSLAPFSATDLKNFRDVPALLPWRRANPLESSPAMLLGTAAHCLILEGEEAYQKRFAFKPEGMSFATRDGKAWRDEHAGADILPAAMDATARVMAAICQTHPAVADLLAECDHREEKIKWTCPTTGLARVGRPDLYGGETLAEFKVSRHAGSSQIVHEAARAGWWHQLQGYRQGIGESIRRVRIIAIHPETPEIRMSLLELDMNSVDLIGLENEATLREVAVCDASGVWPGHPRTWEKADLPLWYQMKTNAPESPAEGEEENG